MSRFAIVVLVLAFGIQGALHAQETLLEALGSFENQSLGHRVVKLGDIDGDGITDLAATGAGNVLGLPVDHVVALSGTDLSPLWFQGVPSDSTLFARSMATIGDLNRDGFSDIAVGIPDAFGAGFVALLSGLDGTILGSTQGSPRSSYGESVAPVGDFDGDGIPDFAVGARTDSQAPVGRGAVYIESGSGLGRLLTLYGDANSRAFGASVAAVGDINRDGTTDLIVGDPLHQQPGTRTAPFSSCPVPMARSFARTSVAPVTMSRLETRSSPSKT